MMQEFVQRVNDTSEEKVNNVHTCFPGIITEFDSAKQLATVQPSMKFKKPDGTSMDYPKLYGVPIVYPHSYLKNATIAYPIVPGDGCLVVCAEQSIDYWMYGQETDTDLQFDMTDAICIPGLFNEPDPDMTEACDHKAIILDIAGVRIKICEDGYVTITASTKVVINGDLRVNGEISASGEVIASDSICLTHHPHTCTHCGSTGLPIATCPRSIDPGH